MLLLHVPAYEELWFRQKMLADSETMSYNSAWGGAIHFSREKWAKWYDRWITNTEGKRFYRYLLHEETGIFVGEIAYHLDEAEGIWLSDVIIHAAYRGRGYGREGLRRLCQAAKENGIDVLYDDIAADNPALKLFLDEGFEIKTYREKTVLLKKDL